MGKWWENDDIWWKMMGTWWKHDGNCGFHMISPRQHIIGGNMSSSSAKKWGTWVISPANIRENGWFLWIYSWWMEQLSLPESIMPWTHSNPTKHQNFREFFHYTPPISMLRVRFSSSPGQTQAVLHALSQQQISLSPQVLLTPHAILWRDIRGGGVRSQPAGLTCE